VNRRKPKYTKHRLHNISHASKYNTTQSKDTCMSLGWKYACGKQS